MRRDEVQEADYQADGIPSQPPEEAPCDHDVLEELLLNSREQCEKLEQIVQMMEIQMKQKDEMIDQLHRDLSAYRQGDMDRFTDQLMRSVITVRAAMDKIIRSPRWEALSDEQLREEYVEVFDRLLDLLEMQDVDAYHSAPGDVFDASIQQPKGKAEPTDDITKDKTIKESLSEGYRRGKRVLVTERVTVYRYQNNEDRKGEISNE